MKNIVERFPDIPVYLALGNHEGFPVNEFTTEKESGTIVSMDWLYGGAVNLPWASSINEEAKTMFQANGYYSIVIKPGIKLISLNSNFCSSENFFLFLDFSDPGDQLAWLVDQLMMSEQGGEVVHILMHHPLSGCLPGWQREYSKILSRFQNTVVAQFHGHTHTDWFHVHHNSSGHPSSVSYIAPSVTTYQKKNPEYRMYTVANDPAHSASFGRVVDTETWTTDLGRSHWAEDVPEWEMLYSARDHLGLKDLSPDGWKDVLRRAMLDDELFHRMVRYNQQDYRDPGIPDRRGFLCHMISNVECDL
jgi:sphingomyelin phosphodiesterase